MQWKLCRLVSPNLLLSILPSASCAANCQQVACCLAKMNWQQFPGVVELRLRKIRAWRRISLLWRSSRFSRSSVFQTRWRSAVVSPPSPPPVSHSCWLYTRHAESPVYSQSLGRWNKLLPIGSHIRPDFPEPYELSVDGLRGKTSIFSHPVYLFLREFSLQDFRGASLSY